jgi:hypothetical protein
MTIEVDADARILKIEGVKFSVVVLEEILNKPRSDVLFSVLRRDDHLEVTTYRDLAAAQKFFDSLQNKAV